MTGWGQHIDDLAAATAALLTTDRVRTRPMQDAHTALGCRDAVVGSLRNLVGAVSDTPRITAAGELTVSDLTRRPGHALHQALSGLPRAVRFGTGRQEGSGETSLPIDEQRWRAAGRATISLERYVDALGRLPDLHAWAVLRDLADLAAALPALDHGLSEAILPWLTDDADLTTAYEMLTHPGHDAVRLAAGEIRARVPATEHPAPSGRAVPTAVLSGGGAGGGELNQAMSTFVQTVSARGGQLSVGDLRAVTRLLELGGNVAAQILERAAPAVTGAGDAAHALQAVGPYAARLRTAPARSMTTEHLGLLRLSHDLQAQLRTLAEQERRLPGGATEIALRRLAAPAVAFAQHIPMLTQALEVSIRQSLANGLMLVPSAADRTNPTRLAWVTTTMTPLPDEPPAVQALAHQLRWAGEHVDAGLHAAEENLHRSAAAGLDATQHAAAAARSHAGVARAQLRAALRQLTDQSLAVITPLPAHPRLTVDTSTRAHR